MIFFITCRYMDNSVAETHSIMYRHSDIDTSRVFKAHPHAKTCTASSSMHQQKSLTETMVKEAFDLYILLVL